MEGISVSSTKRLKTKAGYSKASSRDSTDHYQEENIKTLESGLSTIQSYVSNPIPDKLLEIEIKFNKLFSCLTFGAPIAYVYNPLEYALNLHSQFVRNYCQSEKEILFLGMNPGPWGMSQTGVPFGEISTVLNWFHITGEVEKPTQENPHRPILGLACHRSEIGGRKFWNTLRNTFGDDPHDCCKNLYVHNYCPLAFMTESGKNITPAELKAAERHKLFQICNKLLVEVLFLLNVKIIVAVGRFAEAQSKFVIKKAQLDHLKLLYIPHPSTRNAGANKTWEPDTCKLLKQLHLH